MAVLPAAAVRPVGPGLPARRGPRARVVALARVARRLRLLVLAQPRPRARALLAELRPAVELRPGARRRRVPLVARSVWLRVLRSTWA